MNPTVPVLRLFFDEENDTRPDYRLSRESLNALLSMLHEDRHHGWGQTIKVLVFIFWLACGTSYRVVCWAFSIPKTTVFRSVREVLGSLLHHRGNIIKLPSTEDARKAVSEGFARLANHNAFLGALGAIDGCHIQIKAPVRDANCYFNRKLFHSVVLQAICDHTGRFIDVFCGYPGSTHDARVLRCSPVYQLAAYPPRGHFLLGDGGYPCIDNPIRIITPYREPHQGPVQARFNIHHSRARCIIETSFGRMKCRWRAIFLQALPLDQLVVPKVVVACTMLHNICLGVGDIVDELMEPTRPSHHVAESRGSATRDELAALVSAPVQRHIVLQHHDYD